MMDTTSAASRCVLVPSERYGCQKKIYFKVFSMSNLRKNYMKQSTTTKKQKSFKRRKYPSLNVSIIHYFPTFNRIMEGFWVSVNHPITNFKKKAYKKNKRTTYITHRFLCFKSTNVFLISKKQMSRLGIN